MKKNGHNGYLIGSIILLSMLISYWGNNLSSMYNLGYIDCELQCFENSLVNVLLNTIIVGILPYIIKKINIIFYYNKIKFIYIFNFIFCIIITMPLYENLFDVNGGIGLLGGIIFSIAVFYFLSGNTKEKKNINNNYSKKKKSKNSNSSLNYDEIPKNNERSIESFKCNNCGSLVSKKSKYCLNCGEEFEVSDDDLNKLFTNAKENQYLKDFSIARNLYNEYIDECLKKINKFDKRCYTFNNCIEFAIGSSQDIIEKDCVDSNYEVSNAYMNLGFIDVEEKKYDEALINLNKSLEYNPCNVATLFEISECYKSKKDLIKLKNNINDTYEKIYHIKDLAHYYRDLGYYFIEKNKYDLAKVVYLYSMKYEVSNVAKNELSFIIAKTKDDSLPKNDELIDILKENKIPTFIKKDNLNIIKLLKSKLEESNNLDSPMAKFLDKVIKENANL